MGFISIYFTFEETNQVKALITIHGRETPIELSFSDIIKQN